MRRRYSHHPHPLPKGEGEIVEMAERIMRGDVVDADLADGTFVAVMEELKRRGWGLAERSEAEKWLKPFLLKVERTHGDNQ